MRTDAKEILDLMRDLKLLGKQDRQLMLFMLLLDEMRESAAEEVDELEQLLDRVERLERRVSIIELNKYNRGPYMPSPTPGPSMPAGPWMPGDITGLTCSVCGIHVSQFVGSCLRTDCPGNTSLDESETGYITRDDTHER